MSDAPELWLTLFSAVALAASWRRARLLAPEGADTAGSFRPAGPAAAPPAAGGAPGTVRFRGASSSTGSRSPA